MPIHQTARTFGARQVPTAVAASGCWQLGEVTQARRANIWPKTGDQLFGDVKLLLHMDGANGSTTFIDDSPLANTVTASGNAQISTAQSKFGGSSGLFDGSGDLLTTGSRIAVSGDFTVECFAYPLSVADQIIASDPLDNLQIFRLNRLNDVGSLSFYAVNTSVFVFTGAGVTANEWNHLAICRSGSSTRAFVNGAQVGTTITTWSGGFTFSTIGGRFGLDFNGYIDEFRLTLAARYESNFTVQDAPFPD